MCKFQEEKPIMIYSITLEKLMKELNMSDANYYRWQRGRIKPTITSIISIAQYFNVSIDYLIAEYKNPVK